MGKRQRSKGGEGGCIFEGVACKARKGVVDMVGAGFKSWRSKKTISRSVVQPSRSLSKQKQNHEKEMPRLDAESAVQNMCDLPRKGRNAFPLS